jgi:HAD superfamily hydrolase (TIGR01509 family)
MTGAFMKLKCVLFDFDGVIADSENEVFQYLKKAFLPYGISLTAHDRLNYIGTDGLRCIRDIIDRNRLSLTAEQLLEEKMKLGNYYEDSDRLAPMPGVVELLRQLRKNEVKTGLVSSTRSRLILTALNRMDMVSCFDAIVCGDMVRERKPSPECYIKTLAYLKAIKEDSIAFEDSPTGILAAKAAGIFTVGYKGSEIKQDTSAADMEIYNFYECLDIGKLDALLTK